MEAVRYVELNPVRAGLVAHARDWPWSSARAHLQGRDDGVVEVAPMPEMVGDFTPYLEAPAESGAIEAIRRSRTTGRPVGAKDWLEALEARVGRRLAPHKRGRKPGPSPVDGQNELFHTVSP